MSLNTDHIRATHAGSLPRTPELIAANAAREENPADVEGYNGLLTASVADLVQRQQSLGIDIPNDGEYGHAMSAAVDYGAWWSYSFARMGGLELDNDAKWAVEPQESTPGNVQLTGFIHRRDRAIFAEAYNDPTSGIFTGAPSRSRKSPGRWFTPARTRSPPTSPT